MKLTFVFLATGQVGENDTEFHFRSTEKRHEGFCCVKNQLITVQEEFRAFYTYLVKNWN